MNDAAMVPLMKVDKSLGWESLYEKYSGMMHGAVLRLTQDKGVADKILTTIFLRLNKYNFQETGLKPLYQVLLHFTCAVTKEILASHQIPLSPAKTGEIFPVLNSLLFKALSFKAAAAEHLLTEEECRKKLHLEVSQMRAEMKLKQNQVA